MSLKPLTAVMLAGSLLARGGFLLRQLPLRSSLPLANLASTPGSILKGIRLGIQSTLVHISPAQLVEGVGVAWFIFVLALLLLTRTDRDEPLDCESPVAVSPGSVHLPVPPVTASSGRNAHLTALTSIAATERRRLLYGFFLVAEFIGATSESGEVGRRTVDVVASRVCPLLTKDTALASERLSGLFEMAVLHATFLRRHNGGGTAASLRALVAGIMVMGGHVYVVNVGHCRAYLFRPSSGLLQMTRDVP
jgi:hypothetical protein